MKNTLWDSQKYKKFTEDRNKALEKINLHAQTDISHLLFDVLNHVTGFISHMAIQDQMSVNHIGYISKQLSHYLDQQFQPLMGLIESRLLRMRKNTFVLTYLAELEAIARATQKTKSMNSMDFKHKIQKQTKVDMVSGGQLSKRIWLVLENLKQKILKSFKSAVVRELSPKEVVDEVKKSYPKILTYKVPPRSLKKVREADRKKDEDEPQDQEFDFYAGLTNDSDWQDAVQAYKDTELPSGRFQEPNDPNYSSYDWELEQDITDDFVQQVRDGQVEAAEDLGVKDFVWVSIIDNKTCEVCCLPRNGKTVSEIEAMLSTGELDEDGCDATSPPAHPYCRCDLAPIADVSEVPGPNWKEFGDWLNS